MSQLSRDEVKHVAKLSQLTLTEEEINVYQKQLSEVINYVEQLKEVDVSDVNPTSQTTGLINITRNDEINVERILDQGSSLSEAKEEYNGYFVVPAVIQKEHDDR